MGSGSRATAQGTLDTIERLKRTRDELSERLNRATDLSKEERDAMRKELDAIGHVADPNNAKALDELSNRFTTSLQAANQRVYNERTAAEAAAKAAREQTVKLLNTPNNRAQQATPAQTYFGSMAAKTVTGK